MQADNACMHACTLCHILDILKQGSTGTEHSLLVVRLLVQPFSLPISVSYFPSRRIVIRTHAPTKLCTVVYQSYQNTCKRCRNLAAAIPSLADEGDAVWIERQGDLQRCPIFDSETEEHGSALLDFNRASSHIQSALAFLLPAAIQIRFCRAVRWRYSWFKFNLNWAVVL